MKSKPIKILWIDPISNDRCEPELVDVLRKAKNAGTQIEMVTLPKELAITHLEYHAYGACAIGPIVRLARDAAQRRFDGIVLGCFFDVGLLEAREISGAAVVVAPCQATVQMAANLCNRFSILAGRDKWTHKIESNLSTYGYRSCLASIRCVDLSPVDLQVDPERTEKALIEQAELAIRKDKAEALILGCTSAYGFYERLQEKLAIPVIDSVVASLKTCEHLAALKNRFGWKPSRTGSCEPPPEAQIARWKLFSGQAGTGCRVTIE